MFRRRKTLPQHLLQSLQKNDILPCFVYGIPPHEGMAWSPAYLPKDSSGGFRKVFLLKMPYDEKEIEQQVLNCIYFMRTGYEKPPEPKKMVDCYEILMEVPPEVKP
jgi:hypothetical protein